MAAALRLARFGLGRTWPNPAVGALVVDDEGRILGGARTADSGRPHAEPIALDEAGAGARGATLYVSLEPCAHHGATPPCAQRIVDAGIRRVVYGLDDPDDRVAGQGIERLIAAGIACERVDSEDAAEQVCIGHIRRVSDERPHIHLKMAVSADGMIAGAGNRQVQITGALASRWVHRMRAQADAIMVGTGTVAADNPRLTCRLPGAEHLSPVRVVVDPMLRLSPRSKLVQTANETPTWILTGAPGDDPACDERRHALEATNVRIIDQIPSPAGRIDLDAALKMLAGEGITRLMVEGGAHLARSLVEADLVDEVTLFYGTEPIGNDGLKAFVDRGPELITGSDDFVPVERIALQGDVVRRYRHQG